MGKFCTEIWLLLSGFGIMFAVLSWGQDVGWIFVDTPTFAKGFFALCFGVGLYLGIAKNME